eukprot:TRINITY_DN21338_c0_g1_i1.p1 TRINITY_DN21338_c0_g1~~TRINITY_DN21338_c0_g1_i1.p1  ORF type:complete len:403 (+),score=95.09 TRINITY_DN21338_c0_g1_i1:132-1340(+)
MCIRDRFRCSLSSAKSEHPITQGSLRGLLFSSATLLPVALAANLLHPALKEVLEWLSSGQLREMGISLKLDPWFGHPLGPGLLQLLFHVAVSAEKQGSSALPTLTLALAAFFNLWHCSHSEDQPPLQHLQLLRDLHRVLGTHRCCGLPEAKPLLACFLDKLVVLQAQTRKTATSTQPQPPQPQSLVRLSGDWDRLWSELAQAGWTQQRGARACDVYFLPPGVTLGTGSCRVDYFDSKKQVIKMLRESQHQADVSMVTKHFESGPVEQAMGPTTNCSEHQGDRWGFEMDQCMACLYDSALADKLAESELEQHLSKPAVFDPSSSPADCRKVLEYLRVSKLAGALYNKGCKEAVEQLLERALPTLLSLIHISEPTRLLSISYAVFCLKKKKNRKNIYTTESETI